MTHLLCVSHYCGVITAVGLRGGLGGLLPGMAIENELVDGGKRIQLALRGGVGSLDVSNARTIHRPPLQQLELPTARSRGGLSR
jgi:hypothetical protein